MARLERQATTNDQGNAESERAFDEMISKLCRMADAYASQRTTVDAAPLPRARESLAGLTAELMSYPAGESLPAELTDEIARRLDEQPADSPGGIGARRLVSTVCEIRFPKQ